MNYTGITVARFDLSGLARPTNQFLNETHEFSELVLARVALLMDQGRFPTPVGQSAVIWRVVAGKLYARALDLSEPEPEPVLFGWPELRNGKRPNS